MARGHPVAAVVIEATDQQGFRSVACDRVAVALLVELGLHGGKEVTIEDGGLLARKDVALEGDLTDIEPVAQEMGERTARERDASDRPPALERSHLGYGPPFAKVGHQAVENCQARDSGERWSAPARPPPQPRRSCGPGSCIPAER